MVGFIRARAHRILSPEKANFTFHLTEGVFASFGGHVTGAVILQLLLSEMGYSMATLGFLASLGMVASLMQVVAAPAVESSVRKKRLVLLLGIGQRLPLLMIGLGAALFASSAPHICLIVIVIAQIIGGLTTSVLVAPWLDLVAETIHPQWTGRLFGLRNSISSALAMAAAGLNAAILARVAFPSNYAAIYLIAFGLMAVSWLIFALVDEIPPESVSSKKQKHIHYYRELLGALRDDGRYRWFLAHQALLRLGTASAGFYAVYAARHYGVSPAYAAGAFMIATRVAAIAGNTIFGVITAKVGYKRMMQIGLVFIAAAALIATWAEGPAGFTAVMFVAGLGHAAEAVSVMPFSMRLFPRGRRVGYSALSSVVMLPIGIVAATGTGLMLDSLFSMTFFISALLVTASILPLERCRVDESGESQSAPADEIKPADTGVDDETNEPLKGAVDV